MFKKLGLGFLAVLMMSFSVSANAAVRDFVVEWTQECVTVEGDSLDADGDGVCEMLNGFRFYTRDGEFITAVNEDGSRTTTLRYNAPWGTQCHKMTAVMDDPVNAGAIIESDFSDVGACRDVVPGKPVRPQIRN